MKLLLGKDQPCETQTETNSVTKLILMQRRILYCGDTSAKTAAAYLCGLMTTWVWDFDYVPSDQPLRAEWLDQQHDLFVFSDYPAARVAGSTGQRLVEQVQCGAGLLMIGGWESFHGVGGDWDGSPIGGILPVEISSLDDRRNCDHPVFAQSGGDSHPIIDNLPWRERPPLIGGFNRVAPKPDATVLLRAQHVDARFRDGQIECRLETADPLLVVGQYHAGRTAAFTSDVAPHWIGPMVDWGDSRVRGQAPDAEAVEVGDLYSQFFRQLLEWCRGVRS